MEMCHLKEVAPLAKSSQVGGACADGWGLFCSLYWKMRSHIREHSRYDAYESHLPGGPRVPSALRNVRAASSNQSHV